MIRGWFTGLGLRVICLIVLLSLSSVGSVAAQAPATVTFDVAPSPLYTVTNNQMKSPTVTFDECLQASTTYTISFTATIQEAGQFDAEITTIGEDTQFLDISFAPPQVSGTSPQTVPVTLTFTTPPMPTDRLAFGVLLQQPDGEPLSTPFMAVVIPCIEEAPEPPERRFFPETGHWLAYGFLNFWRENGGLLTFGYPITDEFQQTIPDTGETYTVQYLERQRFEYHPEFQGTPYEVSIGRLGVEDAAARGLLGTEPFLPRTPDEDRPECQFFEATNHYVCYGFLDYWQTHGLNFGEPGVSFRESLALFGYPISDEFTLTINGEPRVVQYFERARFEWHPDNPAQFRILLGRLGAELLPAELTPPGQ